MMNDERSELAPIVFLRFFFIIHRSSFIIFRVDYLAAVPQNAELWVTDRGLRAPHSSCRCSHFKAGGLLILTGRLLDFCLALQTTSVAARATTKLTEVSL
jgi:hypothetical protein